MASESIRIMQWNCRSINNKMDRLLPLLRTKCPDVIALQSLCNNVFSLPNIEGYYYPPITDRRFKYREELVATYVRINTDYKIVDSPCPNEEKEGASCTVQINTKHNRNINVCNIYYPKGCNKINTEWILDVDEGKKWLFVGDFNARHSNWNHASNQEKCKLADDIDESHFVLLNDGSITRIPDNTNHKPSVVDLSFISPQLSPSTTWETHIDSLSSDHLPIFINIQDDSIQSVDDNSAEKFNLQKADWESYRNILNKVDPSSVISDNVNIYYNQVRAPVLAAANETIPKRLNCKGKQPQSKWWNKDCYKNKQRYLAACRRYKSNQIGSNLILRKKMNALFDRTITKAKTDSFSEFLSKVQNPRDTSKIWKEVDKYNNRFNLPSIPLKVNGQVTNGTQEKVEILADTFAKTSQSSNLNKDDLKYRKEQEAKMTLGKEDQTSPINSPMKMKEFLKVIKAVKSSSTAPGKDPICYKMVANLPPSYKKILFDFYQFCWQNNTIPQEWKEAQIIPIPKPGKPKSDPSSYRPISLTPHLGKIYERILKKRLEFYMEKHGILPSFQAGFRKNRSCMEHVVKLTSHLKRALARKSTVFSVFFDVKRAYDSVWHAKLLLKLQDIGISGHMFKFIESFLLERSLHVKIGSFVSKTHNIDMGVPQGSVIAPFLFNIMLYDIGTLKLNGSHLVQFADDIALWHVFSPQNHSISLNEKVFQGKVDILTKYLKENGFNLSQEKTQFMITSRKKGVKKKVVIKVNNSTIKPVKEVKFLGVIINNDLSWESHICHLIKKARKSFNLFKVLLSNTWSSDTKSLLHVCRSLIRSRLTYGQEAFFAAPPTTLNKLDSTELWFLKKILRLTSFAPTVLVYQEINWLPLSKEREMRVAQFQVRCQSTVNVVNDELSDSFDHIHRKENYSLKWKKPTIHKKTIPINDYVANSLGDKKVIFDNIVKVPSTQIPSWTLENPNIIFELDNTCTKRENPLYLAMLAKEKIDSEYKHSLKIYTDGSVNKEGKVGCAFTIPELKVNKKYRLNDRISIFAAELYAIMQACSFVVDLPQPPLKVVIISDSKSSLQAIENSTTNRAELQEEIRFLCHQIITKGTELDLLWVPSHTGIYGNHAADVEANKATNLPFISNDIGYSKQEAYSIIKKTIWEKQNQDLQAIPIARNWLIYSPHHNETFPPLPPSHLKILRRIRTDCCIHKLYPLVCECGKNTDFFHIFENCAHLSREFKPLLDFLSNNNLKPRDFLVFNNTLGWSPTKLLCQSIYQSSIGHTF